MSFNGNYLQQGNRKSSLRDYKGAIEYYNQAIKLQPDCAEAYCNRGICKQIIQNYKGAIDDFNQLIKLKPDYADAYNNRGNCKNDIQDYKGAIDDYSQAIKLQPDYAQVYYNRGNSKYNIQDYKGAIEDCNQAIKIKPDFADTYYSRGVIKNSIQDYKGAIEDFNQAIKLKPGLAEAYNNRGISKYCIQDFKGAQPDYLKALSLSQQPSPLYLFNLANLYLTMNSKKEALQRYSQGVKIFQKYTEADLKEKFKFSNKNIAHIKSSIFIFEKLQKQAQEIRQQAQRKDRKDIFQSLDKFDEAIFSACVKATKEKADQNQVQWTWVFYEKQLEQIKKRLSSVQKKLTKVEAKVKDMEKRIYTEEKINDIIEKIDSRKISEFYKILYNMLINHFMAYRMLSTGFFNENVREVDTFDSIAGKVCKAQSIIESLPILGELVSIPFKILNTYREEKSSRLNSIIADKINGSKLQSEALITFYMSHLIQVLINNKSFNNKLAKALQNQQKSFLNKAMDMFGQLKEKVYSKVFGGTSHKFSYVQQAVTLYMARFTLQLYEVESGKFLQHCSNEETFSAFFMELFAEKTKRQSKIQNNICHEDGNSVCQLQLPHNSEKKEHTQSNTCWQRLLELCCCCVNSDRQERLP